YDLHERIGSGASSTVHRATRRLDGVCVAVKVVRPGGDEALSDARDEVVIHSNLDHEHIVRLLDAFDDQGTLYLVMELCEGGEIFEALVSGDSYDEADAVAVLRKMLEALAYLASKGVAHRDVKLENVLLKSRGGRTDVVLADLGIARRFPTRDRSFAGSPYYVSPEVVLGGAFCAKTDVWSLGVTAYALLTGTMPFHAESALSLNRRICEQPVDFDRPQWASVSAAGRAFVARMLTRDVGRRPGAAALLGDPWI
ncbi:kinase-like domain-containing protein, partial [Pelagophyceae sp. CCMP2097]